MGELTREGDAWTVRFERELPAPPTTVWEALTDPDRLRGWLAAASLDPHVGGRVLIGFDDAPVSGIVERWEPPSLLAYSWVFSDGTHSAVQFTLEAADGGTLLRLEHRGLGRPMASGYAPGWHAYLDRLGAVLLGTEPVAWDERFDELLTAYEGTAG